MMLVKAQEWQAGSAPGRSRDQQASDVALCPNCTERCGQKMDYKHHSKSVTVQEFTMRQSREWVSEWVSELGLTSPSTYYRSFRRRVFPVNHLHWQSNQNNRETEQEKKRKLTKHNQSGPREQHKTLIRKEDRHLDVFYTGVCGQGMSNVFAAPPIKYLLIYFRLSIPIPNTKP